MKFIVILLFLAACGSSSGSKETKKDTTNTSQTDMSIQTDGSKNQEDIHVKLNERFDVRLNAVMGTGNSWWLADSAFKSNLSLDTTFTEVNSSGKDGAPEVQVFRFKGIAKGVTRLLFNYSQPWKKDDKPSDTKTYNVTVE
ncbi:MAG TPA: protease inhibitor I42 family protein [Chitinophagaceae bacterium]|nr:protease inhibitor I42 family protein [Chitinophagaceae bacterium]